MARPLKHSILQVLYIHPYGDSSRRLITKQKGSRGYECQTHGTNVYKLVGTDDLAEGLAYMLAYDSYGNSYYVTKLTAHKATVVRHEQADAPPFQFDNNTAVRWNKFAGAVEGLTVSIENDD